MLLCFPKWIDIIKHLRSYLPTKSLDQIYKMHIRPHFDYCDIIFHKPSFTNDRSLTNTPNVLMNILEKTQYEAALAITGTWKGTNTDKIYEELGWESLHNRRFCRRLTVLYKILNNLSPNYLRLPILTPQNRYESRSKTTNSLTSIRCRNLRFKNSFYPHTIDSWNKIDTSLKESTSLSVFKSSLIKIVRPPKKSMFVIFDHFGSRLLFQLRVGPSQSP